MLIDRSIPRRSAIALTTLQLEWQITGRSPVNSPQFRLADRPWRRQPCGIRFFTSALRVMGKQGFGSADPCARRCRSISANDTKYFDWIDSRVIDSV
jgi:hypothetical protein